MKFLCVQCDSGMKLQEVSGPDEDGSLAVVYKCAACDQQIAMLTNAHETQMVSSLGVKIGPDGKEVQGASKCPFTGAVREATEKANQVSSEFSWTVEAETRLAAIPEFIRPMARTGIEQFAKAQGITDIDVDLLDRARAELGMA